MISDPGSRSRITIFLFRARLKNPEYPEILWFEIGIWKSRKNPEWKIAITPKSPGSGFIFSGYPEALVWNYCNVVFTTFWASEFFRDFLQIPGIRDFLSLMIFIPGFRDFFESRDFYPVDSGFFTFGIGIFFRGMGYPDKKPTLPEMMSNLAIDTKLPKSWIQPEITKNFYFVLILQNQIH